MIEMRVLIWPNGNEVLQYRFLQQNQKATTLCLDHWSEWFDAPRIAVGGIVVDVDEVLGK